MAAADLLHTARLYNPDEGEPQLVVRSPRSCQVSMDFETVRFLRIIFAVVFAAVGGAAGVKYGPVLLGPQNGPLGGPIVGAVIGAIVGWNTVDLIKGRARK